MRAHTVAMIKEVCFQPMCRHVEEDGVLVEEPSSPELADFWSVYAELRNPATDSLEGVVEMGDRATREKAERLAKVYAARYGVTACYQEVG